MVFTPNLITVITLYVRLAFGPFLLIKILSLSLSLAMAQVNYFQKGANSIITVDQSKCQVARCDRHSCYYCVRTSV